MADGNLLSALSGQRRYNGLQNLVLFGRVRCAIEKPSFLSDLKASSGGFFALLDACGVKCLGEDYFGYSDTHKVYFLRGSILIYLDDKSLIGENIKVFGSSKNKGVNIRRQFKAKSPKEGISAFAFKKQGSDFVVIPNSVDILLPRDATIKGTSLEDYIAHLVAEKYSEITYPETMYSIEAFEGAEEYSELDLDSVESVDSTVYTESEEMVDVTKSPIDLEYHFAEDISKSPIVPAIAAEIKSKNKQRFAYARRLIETCSNLTVEELKEDFNPEEYGCKGSYIATRDIASSICELFVKNIVSNGTETLPGTKVKCRQFVYNFMDNIYATFWKDDENAGFSMKSIKPCIDSVKSRVLANPSILLGNDSDYENGAGGIPLLHEECKFAALVIATSLGIPEHSIVGSFNQCYAIYGMGITDWFCMLIRIPYALGMLTSCMSVGECDRIAFSYGKIYNKGVLTADAKDARETLLFLENMNSMRDKDSFIPAYVLSKQLASYPWKYRQGVMNHGFPANIDNTVCTEKLLGVTLKGSVPKNSCYHNPYNLVRVDKLCNQLGLLQDIESGDVKYYALSSDVEKEFLIYTKLYDKGQTLTGITDELIDETIAEFEEKCGFKLEQLQKDGVKLCKYGASVLSGCAGSGKTTTSDCMTMVFQKAFPDREICYSTPTGKACRRLAEVTGKDVRTLHSRFNLGIYSDPYLCSVRDGKTAGEKRIYIFDEMAMCSMDLLYNTVRNISASTDMVYFLGDIKQLPPIGRGNPFKLLMTFLPCVELGVSKRAAAGSLVNYNTSLISNFSDSVLYELKYDNKTFVKRECTDAEIPKNVVQMFKGFMSGSLTGTKYSEDDIQVITGYQKEDCLFSAPVLNKPLHDVLRAEDRLLYTYNNKQFRVNERVMHMSRNAYEMPRYRKEAPGVYKGVVTFGSVNGEMGKITGFVRSDRITTESFDADEYRKTIPTDDKAKLVEMNELLSAYQERAATIIDNSVYNDEETYFVEVKVYDVSLREDVYLLYRANRRYSEQAGEYFEGGDLPYLEYAYALTTHKMQGSQSPVVICVFGSTCNPEFINRNMINTMMTRSQGIVGVVGSVTGENSPINQGRRKVSTVYCKDLLSVLSGVEI